MATRAPTSSSTPTPAYKLLIPGHQLPPEVLFEVFNNLGNALDLYNASLSCRSWRNVAVDPRLWESHYSRFYRARGGQDDPLRQWLQYKRHEAMRLWIERVDVSASSNASSPTASMSSSSPSLPPFLDYTFEDQRPDFHSLFMKRMNTDQRLLASLLDLVHLKAGILDGMLNIVDAYRDDARDFLAALAADQQVDEKALWRFASQAGEDAASQTHLRAIDIHRRGATGQPRPHPDYCLSLQHAARQVLAHLQRREAVRSMQTLYERSREPRNKKATLRERVARGAVTVEASLKVFACFGQGEACELGHYLDLLALYVWVKLQAEQQVSPPSSTRQRVRFLLGVLRELGFGVASDDVYLEPQNGLPNITLHCPTYRQSNAYTWLATVCGVATRLGIAMTLGTTSSTFMAIALEDGDEPSTWEGDDETQEWRRFFLLGLRDVQDRILEVGAVKSQLRKERFTEESLSWKLDPPRPLDIMVQANLHFLVISQRRQWEDEDGPASAAEGLRGSLSPGGATAETGERSDLLTALGNYLYGQTSSLPQPLVPPLQRSSLAFLPSTHAGAPRLKSRALYEEVDGIMYWVFRIMGPSTLGGGRLGNGQILSNCVSVGVFPRPHPVDPAILHEVNGPHPLDLALLLEVNGGNVAEELALARSGGPPDEEQEDLKSAYGYDDLPPYPTPDMRCFAAKVLQLDRSPCSTAIGGPEGAVLKAEERDPASLRLNDEAVPAERRARHVIGTVFKHRTEGYYGVVIGRESECRAEDDWIAENGVDDLPSGGSRQPFYNVIAAHDESHRYVAQCNIEPIRLNLHSKDEVMAVLRELAALFNFRSVGRLFRTVSFKRVDEDAGGIQDGGIERNKRKRSHAKEVEVRLVMNERMSEAWPYD